jgi:hypothetical protein
MLEMLWLDLARQIERGSDDEFGGGQPHAAPSITRPLIAWPTGADTWAWQFAQVARRKLARFLPELGRAFGHGPFQAAMPVAIDRTRRGP